LFLSGAETETAYEISFSVNKTDWTVAALITRPLQGGMRFPGQLMPRIDTGN
jgi:exoribonuclease II